MSKYFFSNEEQKQCIVPFRHKTEEEARCYKIEYDIKSKQELLDDSKALYNLHFLLFTMLMDCRKLKKIELDEEDCKLLFDMSYKQVEINLLKIKEK